MRATLASAVGVACTAALALPLTPGQGAIAAPHTAAPHAAPASAALPGSTQSLPLSPLARPASSPERANVEPEYGITARKVRPFSLVGVVWDDARADLHGQVQVRTRAAGTDRWSGWQDVETHGDDAPDLDAADRRAGRVRGATAPLWVGDSDGVQLRVRPHARPAPDRPLAPTDRHAAGPLPSGLRLELVHPGDPRPAATAQTAGPADPATKAGPADGPAAQHSDQHGDQHSDQHGDRNGDQLSDQYGDQNGDAADPAEPQAPDQQPDQPGQQPDQPDQPDQSTAEATTDNLVLDQTRSAAADLVLPAETDEQAEAQRDGKRRYLAPRPRIILRKGWSADERLRERQLGYTRTVKAAFVHHSATGNNYRCAQAPSVIRSIYRYHVKSSGWRDLGYNFLVDKCGNIYEGRAGGPGKPVLGAHTLGFNSNSTGIAVLGTYSRSTPPKAAVRAVAKLTAWKLGLHGRNPAGSTYLVSGGSNKYRKGVTVRLKVISGHRDGFTTDCPGTQLYRQLGAARYVAARLQGR
ncbi:peptidoglycan recognition protein [Streptomyces sp. 71268]|uniref:peptidoglycan recognition protein family protein n=1 Tax=Streptomyces sp. 71268 TaxID=3002640 RepID=UPI0023F79DD0|nr:peptidoglycan recognition protein [Streptomyces sp. 71268]WEV27481.1 peptidoglycan recognition protein [Streptomyces sp. 71268]